MAKKYNAVVNSEKDVSQTFIKGAAILTLSMVIVKVFGLLDKVILANIYSLYGDQYATMGMGLYSNAFEIFVVIFTVATGGLPIAISRLISESMAEKRYNDTDNGTGNIRSRCFFKKELPGSSPSSSSHHFSVFRLSLNPALPKSLLLTVPRLRGGPARHL